MVYSWSAIEMNLGADPINGLDLNPCADEKQTTMKKRALGKRNLEVSSIGLGCMGLSGAYAVIEKQDAIKLIRSAFNLENREERDRSIMVPLHSNTLGTANS